MGMDGVEIVMAVEEAFCIPIADAEAEIIETPRGLIDLIMSKVGRTDPPTCLTQRSFYLLRACLIRTFGLPRIEITPHTRLRSIISREQSPTLAQTLSTDLGTTIPLVKPAVLAWLLFAGSVAIGIITTVQLKTSFGLAAFGGIVTTCLVGYAGSRATRRYRTEFPRDIKNVGDLSRWLVAHKPDLAGAPPQGWTREQISLRVREIVVDILCCEKQYREDARFIEDLGMS